jgi:hypothetical protein
LVEIESEYKWKFLSSQLYLLSTLTHTEELNWWTGGHFNPSYGFSWFYSGSHVYYSDWALFEPSNFEDSSIYLSMLKPGGSHLWYSEHAEKRNGHPICEK